MAEENTRHPEVPVSPDTGTSLRPMESGFSHAAVTIFWDEFFQMAGKTYPAARLIDIATGHGALLEIAMATFGEDNADATYLDSSAAIINSICRKFPRINSVQADTRSMPLDPESFDIVTSQFGIDCTSMDAIGEATRLLKPDGCLAMLINHREGVPCRQARHDLDAIVGLQQAEFIPLARVLLSTGFEACRGTDRTPYEAAAIRFAPAVQALESILSQFGEEIAGGLVARLYSDVDHIHRNMQRYEAGEVLAWLQGMEQEVQAHAERLSTLCSSSIDEQGFGRICETLRGQGFTLLRTELLPARHAGDPLAWALVASRGNRLTAMDWPPEQAGEAAHANGLGHEKLQAWVKQQVTAAISELTRKGVFSGLLVEAKPAWVLPFQIVIGKVRERGQVNDFDWFICGETPTDQTSSQAASTPREAARYFALKWQRDAARQQELPDPDSDGSEPGSEEPAADLARRAEALYALVDDPRVWPAPAAEI